MHAPFRSLKEYIWGQKALLQAWASWEAVPEDSGPLEVTQGVTA